MRGDGRGDCEGGRQWCGSRWISGERGRGGGQAVELESITGAAVLKRIPCAGHVALELGGGCASGAEDVTAVAFAAVLGAEEGVAGAVGGAGFECHVVVGVRGRGECAGGCAFSLAADEGVGSDGRFPGYSAGWGGSHGGGAGGSRRVELETVASAAELGRVARASHIAIRSVSLAAAAVKAVSAVTFPAIFGSPIVEAGAVTHA